MDGRSELVDLCIPFDFNIVFTTNMVRYNFVNVPQNLKVWISYHGFKQRYYIRCITWKSLWHIFSGMINLDFKQVNHSFLLKLHFWRMWLSLFRFHSCICCSVDMVIFFTSKFILIYFVASRMSYGMNLVPLNAKPLVHCSIP